MIVSCVTYKYASKDLVRETLPRKAPHLLPLIPPMIVIAIWPLVSRDLGKFPAHEIGMVLQLHWAHLC